MSNLVASWCRCLTPVLVQMTGSLRRSVMYSVEAPLAYAVWTTPMRSFSAGKPALLTRSERNSAARVERRSPSSRWKVSSLSMK